MDDAVPPKRRPPEQQRPRGHVLTPRRIAAVIALALLAVSLTTTAKNSGRRIFISFPLGSESADYQQTATRL
jgi:hypothetical protein